MNNTNEITSTSRSVKVSKRQSNARFRLLTVNSSLLTVFAVLLCLLFCGKTFAQSDETVIIGNGTTGGYYCPIGTYYNYSITEQLYTASEIGTAGTIKKISFYYLYTATAEIPITVYMKHVADADLSSTGISFADAQQVFSGNFSVSGSAGWYTITLDSNFEYNGEQNLLIGIVKGYYDYSTFSNNNTWQCTPTGSTMARYTQNDNSAYSTSTIPATVSTNRPNIKIELTPLTPTISQSTTPLCGEDVTLTASLPGGASVPSGYTYHWYSNSTCTTEITSGVSGTNNNQLTIASSDGGQVWCRLEKAQEQQVTNFEYTGTVKTYTIPNGTTSLTLEVWGAQGGSYNSTYTGGKGGYAVGTLNNPSGTLYVVVGGQGTSVSSSTVGGAGGYNGGGAGGQGSNSSLGIAGSGGGGATHIATTSGLLSTLSSNTSSVLLVAGGGGGASGAATYGSTSSLNESSTACSGGAAGVAGGKASGGTYNGSGGTAGTTSSAGTGGAVTTAFSSNADGYYYTSGGGGAGAGYYGGGGGAGGSTSHSSYRGSAGSAGGFGYGGAGGRCATYQTSTQEYYGGGGGSGAGGASYVSASLQNATPYNGNVSFASISGASETGHPGDGYARITATVKPCGATGSHTIVCNDCPVIAVPTAYSASGCGYAPLTASAPTGCVVDWYDAASGGNLVHTGSPFDATTSGTYYAESRNSSSNCTSSTRTSATATVWIFNAGAVSGSATRCQGTDDDIIISATEAQGKPTISYKWYMDGEEIASSNTQNYTIPGSTIATLSPGTYTFTRMAFNNCGGEGYVESSGSFTLTIVEQPTASITNGIQHVCKNTSANALGVIVNGAGDMSYDCKWYQAGNVTPVATTSTYTPPTGTAGNNSYYCTVLFDDDYGCADASTGYAQIEVYELPTTVLSSDYSNTCRGSEITLSAATTPGSGTESFSYDWASVQTGGGAPQSTGSTDECTMVPYNGGTYTYRVTVTDNYHCSATSTVAVKVYDDVVISGAPASAIDPGTLITLTATPQLGASAGNTSDCSYHWISSVLNGIMSYDDNPASDRPNITTYYSVVATVTESGCTIQSSPQEVEVNASSGGINETCGNSVVIYCTNNGSGTTGSSTDPMSLTTALTKASQVSSRTAQDPVIIRMATGDYTFATTINLQSNVIIDGGWNANTTSGVWTKGNGTTKIKGTFAEVTSNNTKHRIALKSENKTGWRLQDLTIDVTGYTYNGGTDFNGTSYKGNSVYGIYMTGTSTGDSLIRVNLKVGDGGKGGTKNVTFTYTTAQLKGGNGSQATDCPSQSPSGGSAFASVTGSRKGGNGGSGGSGGGWSSSSSSGSDGSAGGGGAAFGSGGSSVSGVSFGSGKTGNNGDNGIAGSSGNSYTGSTPTALSYGAYFNPGGLGRTGTDGQGGGGGGGASGGSGGSFTRGNPGSGGGAGGAGGQGGGGAAGGGASFGIYCYGSALPVFESTKITVGNAGQAGTGQTGQTGGDGGTGPSGYTSCDGGNGGKGGNGGAGGKGADGESGVAGVAYKIAVVSGGTLNTSQSVASGASQYTTTPSNYISSIDYGSYSKKGCTNSQIAVTKTSGTFATTYTINDETPSSASYSGNNAIMAFPSTGRYLATTATSQYNPYIFITQERTLGSITGSPTEFCQGSSPAFQYSGSLSDGEVCLWYLVDYDDGSEVDTYMEQYNGSALAGYTIPESVPGGHYYIKLILKSNCCGLSVPIWKEITIFEKPQVASAVVTDALCYGGNGSVVVTASDGTPSYSFSSDGGSNWTAANNPYTFELPYGDYDIVVKDANECVSDAEPVSIAQPDEFNPGAIETDGQTLCYNTGTLNEIGNHTSASGGEGVISYQWYVNDAEISGATSAAYTPASTYKTTPGTYTFTRKAHYGSCDWVVSTGEWVLTIRNEFTPGVIASTGEAICKDATPTEIGSTTAASGGDGNIHYQWYVGSTAIDGATSATYTPTAYAATAGTYIFTRKANDGECNTTPTASTGSWTLTVEESSVGTVTASASPATICIGSSATLSVSAEGNSGAMSYVWEGGSTSVTPNVTTTYHVTATATTAGAGCTAETVEEVEVAVATPSVDGIASGDMVWSGKAGTTNWATAGNWLTYSASAYSVAASAPSASTNVFLATYGECVTSNPALTAAASTKNLTIGSGRSLDIDEYTLSVAGNLTNSGTFTAGTGTVVFNGSTHQTISGSSLTLNNVTFNNDKNFTFSGLTPTVTGLATFTAGIVNGDMNFGASATTASASRASYVEGKVTKVAGSSAFTFPTGNAGVLGSVTAIPTADTWVRFHNLVASGDALPADYPRFWNPNDNCDNNDPQFDHVSNFEYWDINSPAGLSNATIVASADNASKHFGSTDPAPTAEDVLGAIWTGSCWKNLGGSNQDISDENRTIRVEGVAIPAVTRAGTPYFTLGSKTHETLLPIELVSFTAQCDGRSSLVEWTTATEKNNDYFSLERSDDAVNFTEIARVAGAGNSIEPIDYAYTDYGIHGGDNYYRLVQVDYDGTRTVSEIVVANCIEPEVGEPDVQAYPNPFSSDLTVVLDNFGNRAATIEVYDMLGKLIYTDKVAAPQNSYETILNLSNLPPAAYTVRVSTTDFVVNRNVVKN